MMGSTHHPWTIFTWPIADTSGQIPDASSSQAIDNLTHTIQHLSTQLNGIDERSYEPYGWTQPATHFIDSLPNYGPLALAMVLATVLLFGVLVVSAWSQYKRGIHQRDVLGKLSVPLSAFTSVVEQQTATTDILSRRLETMGDQVETMGESINRLTTVLSRVLEHSDDQAPQTFPHRRVR